MIEFNTGVLMVNLVTLADFEDMVLDGIGFEITTFPSMGNISPKLRNSHFANIFQMLTSIFNAISEYTKYPQSNKNINWLCHAR